MVQITPRPGPVHHDVLILEALFRTIEPGKVLPYADAAKAIGMEPGDPLFRSRALRARIRLLRDHQISIGVVSGVGFLRETDEQKLARLQRRERPSVHRKVRKLCMTAAAIDATKLSRQQQTEFFCERTILGVLAKFSDNKAVKRLEPAVAKSQPQIALDDVIVRSADSVIEAVAGRNGQPEAAKKSIKG